MDRIRPKIASYNINAIKASFLQSFFITEFFTKCFYKVVFDKFPWSKMLLVVTVVYGTKISD